MKIILQFYQTFVNLLLFFFYIMRWKFGNIFWGSIKYLGWACVNVIISELKFCSVYYYTLSEIIN